LPKLKNRAVSYINADICVSGSDIDATASIPLKRIIQNALRNVPDPFDTKNYDRTYFDYWKEKAPSGYMQVLKKIRMFLLCLKKWSKFEKKSLKKICLTGAVPQPIWGLPANIWGV
jgi:hypothetical protein